MIRLITTSIVVAALGACSSTVDRVGDAVQKSDAFTGSPHGYAGQINTDAVDIQGFPTIAPDGYWQITGRQAADGSREDAISTYSVEPDGTLSVTGLAAQYLALSRLCVVAPNIGGCGAFSE